MHFFKTLVAFFLYVFFAMPSFSATLKPGEREEAHHFDVFLLGIKAGELRYHKSVKGTVYSAEAVLETTGLVALLAPYLFQAKVTGQRLKSRYFPKNYMETSNTGSRITNKEMRYKNQRPTLLTAGERKKYWLKPADQKGTLDPLSALLALLDDAVSSQLCKVDLPVFDGERRVSLSLSGPTKLDKGGVACQGIYTRLGGFSKQELSDGITFPFYINYHPVDAGYRVAKFSFSTLRGTATFERR